MSQYCFPVSQYWYHSI